MAQLLHFTRRRAKSIIALLLTFAAGNVDIVCYLAIYKIFTAHMTGNTVHLAERLFGAQMGGAGKAAAVIGAFLVGSIAGRSLIEVGSRKRLRSIASATLLIEFALIAAVIPTAMVTSGVRAFASITLLATAMGVQTATLTRIGSLTVHTTFVTGMLNKLAQLASRALFLTYDASRNPEAATARKSVVRQAQFIFSVWMFYFVGAAAGAWATTDWGIRSLFIPMGLIFIAVVGDQVWPLSIEEEHDEV